MQHAKLSPSASSRWINCTGSILLSDLMADKYGTDNIFTSSNAANEGSLAHEISEKALKSSKDTIEFIGYKAFNHTADESMCAYTQEYVDFVRSIPGTRFIEQQVTVNKDLWGTADAIVINADTLHTVDLKFGMGVKVYATNNTQARIYALGTIKTLSSSIPAGVKKVTMTIHQPRLDHIDSETITLTDLFKWEREVLNPAIKAVQASTSDLLDLHPSESACKFCPAKAYCPKLYSDMIELFDNNVDEVTDTQLSAILDKLSLIESWSKSLRDRAFNTMRNGGNIDGYKLVEGRSMRKWKDESHAIELLSTITDTDKLFTRKFVSPSQAEKIIGKKTMVNFLNLISKPPGKPTIVSIHSKKPAITSSKVNVSLFNE